LSQAPPNDSLGRRLQDVARERRGDVNTHTVPAHGYVAEIFPVDGFGFIQADEHRVYFSRAGVLNEEFDALAVGTPVAFAGEQGDRGPQASTVHVRGRPYVGP
jgi:cold shock CspA family protein